MKKLIYSTILAVVAAAGFTACSDDEVKYDGPGKWDANPGYADIYFKQTSKTESIDPAAPTTCQFNVYRRVQHQYTWGKDSQGKDSITDDKIVTPLPALTVKPTILTNTDDVFSLSDAVFAEGDTVATITAQFPNATIGKQHTLAVTVEGADLVSSYSNSLLYTYNVTRVKWNSIGKGKFRDDFWFEDSWEVEIMQRDDDHSYYRIMDPFGGAPDELDGSQSEYVELHILKKGDKIGNVTLTEAGVVDWYRISTGYFHSTYNDVIWCLHPQNFTSASLSTPEVYAKSKVKEYLDNGEPGQIQLACYYYMFSVGGWNRTGDPTIFINMPGFVEQYEATIYEDFEFNDVYEGVWKSNQLGTTTTATLQQGVCVTTTDNCDSVFAATYGTVYKIKAPYAEDYDLIFCAKGKKITVAPGYEYPQPIGITALGEDIFAIINSEGSSFADGVVTLNIDFVSIDNNNNALVYANSNEQLLNLTYSEVGSGVYTYGVRALSQGAESYYEGSQTATLFQCDQLPGEYYLTPWAKSETGLAFTVQDDNTIKFFQSTGESYVQDGEDYGTVYFFDIEEYNPAYQSYLGKYDGDKTFEFVGSYYILPNVGGFGLIGETFVLGDQPAAGARKLAARDLHLNKTLKAAPRFDKSKAYERSLKKVYNCNDQLSVEAMAN